eukprot:CAMPEP_0171071400 /NCGR_PEP_ID=MMETSP0766_2-20121228/10306_1 /TAXON_ID=439317 /ORGANISM="Gambierdiscus australes, Strain CAWD 149" /LENGTH=116 /DNA_ID=CAMNT_0011527941 /DNA_START=19 /DNA_END=369 /DNA_ORIENTATION=-
MASPKVSDTCNTQAEPSSLAMLMALPQPKKTKSAMATNSATKAREETVPALLLAADAAGCTVSSALLRSWVPTANCVSALSCRSFTSSTWKDPTGLASSPGTSSHSKRVTAIRSQG